MERYGGTVWHNVAQCGVTVWYSMVEQWNSGGAVEQCGGVWWKRATVEQCGGKV